MGSDELAPDGSPIPVYLALPAEPAFTSVMRDLEPGATVLDLGCGVGRLANELARRGHDVCGIDESVAMLQHVHPDVTTTAARIEELDLERRFDAVVLASHLVNVADVTTRHAFLATVARHLARSGVAYIQHYDRENRFEVGIQAHETQTSDGILRLTTQVHERRGSWLRATVTMELDDARWDQHFEAEFLDDVALAASLEAAGLRLVRRLDPVWIAAERT